MTREKQGNKLKKMKKKSGDKTLENWIIDWGLFYVRDTLYQEAGLICYWNLDLWLDKRLKSWLVIGQKAEIVQSASRCKASFSLFRNGENLGLGAIYCGQILRRINPPRHKIVKSNTIYASFDICMN